MFVPLFILIYRRKSGYGGDERPEHGDVSIAHQVIALRVLAFARETEF
jgi:hypothetical protein